jgi:hypothetical protein
MGMARHVQIALAKLRLSLVWDAAVLAQSLWRLGWFRSWLSRRPSDAAGRPLPWMTYAFIGFMQRRSDLLRSLAVFEWGSGYSTLWWSQRCATVEAIECNAKWYGRMSELVPANVTLRHVAASGSEYEAAILTSGRQYDIIVIDGRRRIECARAALTCLSPKGVVVLDNSYRAEYAPAVHAMHAAGFRRLEFVGLGPICGVLSETSVFYRNDNCLGL